jgi:hypothetical protein
MNGITFITVNSTAEDSIMIGFEYDGIGCGPLVNTPPEGEAVLCASSICIFYF